MTGPFAFQIHSTDGNARSSTLRTPHGPVEMPAFAPVGTAANVKTLEPRDLSELNTSLLLANTYHLYLRPGHDLIERLGGLHSFMGWDGPILTDSGGYQVFSLAHRRSLDADGVTFRSHIDGSTHRFTPERVIEIEERLGADIAMVLDECADPLDAVYLAQALSRTHAWAERCRAAHSRPDQALFGIVQGGIYPELRAESARILTGLDFAGYAIGGLAVGETKEQMYATLDATCGHLPVDRPRYLMGVGAPEDILESVARGVDLFDCVLPTRIARNGTLLTLTGRFNIRNARFAEDSRPIQEECGCYTCRTFSRAYLRHLFISGEISGLRLATIHNLHFMQRLMAQIRTEIGRGTFASFRDGFLQGYRITDQRVRHEQRRRRAEALPAAS
ncbi:MAG: tRNA guanosine(34) transglycosylase Tgt [Caldilineaceae bacterium]|nr:tRNA guanosine(34) transglycosylase Tgt [Caldilineaceae bacterium]